MKVQVADSWQTQLRRRFECNLQSMATCMQQLHLYCCFLQEIDYCLFLTDDPGDFADKEIFYIIDCHNVTLLLKSAACTSLNMVRTVRQTLLCSQLACNEMQALARTCGRSSCSNSRLSTSTRGRSCRHPLPVARKTAFNLENWSSSAGKQHSFVVSVDLD